MTVWPNLLSIVVNFAILNENSIIWKIAFVPNFISCPVAGLLFLREFLLCLRVVTCLQAFFEVITLFAYHVADEMCHSA